MSFLCLGAGVQSSALLMMSEHGDMPKLDFAVFADTQWEPAAVYENLEWLKRNTSIPIHVVSRGNVRQGSVNGFDITMPVFTSDKGMLSRQCTRNYKIAPIRSFLYDYVDRKTRNTYVHQWMGISSDESMRMRDSDVMWVDFHYPLVDAGITREDCKTWMTGHGYPEPPRSSCIGCPYRSGEDWRELTPVEWKDATSFDESIGKDLFLHHSRVPLVDARLDSEGSWGEECSGMCGI